MALLVCGLSTAAIAKEYTCLPSIKTDAKQGPLISGFVVWHNPQSEKSTKSIVYNANIDLYDGHPDGMAQLKPDNGDDDLSDSPNYWALSGGSSLWMACLYSDTDRELIKHLDNVQKNAKQRVLSLTMAVEPPVWSAINPYGKKRS